MSKARLKTILNDRKIIAIPTRKRKNPDGTETQLYRFYSPNRNKFKR